MQSLICIQFLLYRCLVLAAIQQTKHIALPHSNSIGRSKMFEHNRHKMSLFVGLGSSVRLGKKGSGAIAVTLDIISAGMLPFGLPSFGVPPFEAPPTRKLVK